MLQKQAQVVRAVLEPERSLESLQFRPVSLFLGSQDKMPLTGWERREFCII
jgi:hypothetical protein